MTWATKKLGDFQQHYSELQEIICESNGIEKWMLLTAIANKRSRDPKLGQRCHNCAYSDQLTKLNRKSKANKWYTTRDSQQAKQLVCNRCAQLEEEIDCNAMALKWFWRFIMPNGLCPEMDDHDHTNLLRTISLSVLHAPH